MEKISKAPNTTGPEKTMIKHETLIKHETFKGFIEFCKENLDGKNPICYTENMKFSPEDLPYFNETINDFFINNLKNLIKTDDLLNFFMYLAKIGLETRNELLKNIDIHCCLKDVKEEIIKKFFEYYDVNLEWDYFNDNYKDIIKIYPIVKPSEKERFIYETIIKKLKKITPYSQKISNKKISKIIKENEKVIKFENYAQYYQLGLLEIKDIPIQYFQCEFIHKVMETNKFPIMSAYVKGKKEEANFYEEFFKQDFPEEELLLLSKTLIININTLRVLPENKEVFLNFLQNSVKHSDYCGNEVHWDNRILFNNKFYLNKINHNFREIFGFNKQKFSFEECQSIFNDFLNKKSIFHFEPDYFSLEKKIDQENLFLILEKDFQNHKRYQFENIIFNLIKEMMTLKEEPISIRCSFNLSYDIEKRINSILYEKNIYTYLFLKNNQKIKKFNIELKKVNYENKVLQIKRFILVCFPKLLETLPHAIFKDSILEKILKFTINKTNDELKEFFSQPILVENYPILNRLVDMILKSDRVSEDKKEIILRAIKDLPCQDKFIKNIRDKIKLLDIDQKSEKFVDNLKTGCKRKYEEITEDVRLVLQKPNLEDDVKDALNKLLHFTKEKVVLNKIIENPMIKCPISVEYHEASNFYTLNCGHQFLKNTVQSLRGSCPMCRTQITTTSETVIQNDYKELIEQLSDF